MKKLLGITENKITKYENGENVPHLEITKVVLVLCNTVNNDYQQDSKVLYTLFLFLFFFLFWTNDIQRINKKLKKLKGNGNKDKSVHNCFFLHVSKTR